MSGNRVLTSRRHFVMAPVSSDGPVAAVRSMSSSTSVYIGTSCGGARDLKSLLLTNITAKHAD